MNDVMSFINDIFAAKFHYDTFIIKNDNKTAIKINTHQ